MSSSAADLGFLWGIIQPAPGGSNLWELFESCWFSASPFISVLRVLPVVLCWTLWKLRTEKLYGVVQKSRSPIPLALSVLQQLGQLKPYEGGTSVCAVLENFRVPLILPHRVPKVVRWQTPLQMKLNTDGSCSPEGAGVGWILRGRMGEIKAPGSVLLGPKSILYAETAALWHGLSYAHQHCASPLEVELDSLNVVHFLNGSRSWPWEILRLLSRIKPLMTPLVRVRHIYREANKPADALAKLAVTSSATNFYSPATIPVHVKVLAQFDASQFADFRTTVERVPFWAQRL